MGQDHGIPPFPRCNGGQDEHGRSEPREATERTEQDRQECTAASRQSRAGEVPADAGERRSFGERAEQLHRATLSPELLLPRPTLWPWGTQARERRAQRTAILAEGTRRRAQLIQTATQEIAPPSRPSSGTWRPVSQNTNRAALAGLTAMVLLIFGLSAWFASTDPAGELTRPPSPSPSPVSASALPSSPAATAPPTGAAGGGLPPRYPIPRSGVAPITPPAGRPPTDPDSLSVVAAPPGPVPPAELATPESAAVAWLARWCPFGFADPAGAAEARAVTAMTPEAGRVFGTVTDRARRSWDRTVAAQENAACSTPEATVSGDARRTDTSAVVIVSAARVVSGSGGRYVEDVTETRILLRGSDDLWRVDADTQGG